ncbi:MAG TPA: hypothetical protein VFU16_01145 [Solirubrobacterales bacterium]|nr:hypothetical protein [Solirubrobacterales bacterium]
MHPVRFVFSPPQKSTGRLIIPIAEAASSTECLVDDHGQPVWPIASSEHYKTLERLAEIFGGELSEAGDAKPGTHPSPRDELVLGVEELAPELQLYAHLTGRSFRSVPDQEEIGDYASPAVVLSCSDPLDAGLIELLHLSFEPTQPVGIIWGRTQEELHLQLLIKSAAAVLDGPNQLEHVTFPDPAHGVIDSASVQHLCRDGVGVLTIKAHSDGIAQPLGGEATLCPRMSEHTADLDAEKGPLCVSTGHCQRLKVPVETAADLARLVPPEMFAARLMVSMGCQLVFLGSDAIDSAWGVFTGLAMNPEIGALVASPDPSVGTSDLFQRELVQHLLDGRPIGDSLRLFQENPTVREWGHHLTLFGDPMVKGTRGGKPRLATRDNGSTQQAEAPAHTLSVSEIDADIELLRGLSRVIKPETKTVGKVTSSNLLEALRAYEQAPNGTDEGEQRGRDLREAVFEHLATSKVRLFEAWVAGATLRAAAEVSACPVCGWRTYAKIGTLPSGARRELFLCPRCTDAVDRPLGAQASRLSLTSDQVTIEDLSTDTSAALFAVRGTAAETVRLDWPRKGNAMAQNVAIHPEEFPGGPMRIHAVLITGLSIQSACMPLRGSAPDTADP